MDNASSQPQVSFRKPLVVFLLPFILFLPTFWFFHSFIPEHSEMARQLGEVEHMRIHWGMFWIVTFLPFTAFCFLYSLIMFVMRSRGKR